MVPSKRFASRSFGSLLRTASQVSFAPSKALSLNCACPIARRPTVPHSKSFCSSLASSLRSPRRWSAASRSTSSPKSSGTVKNFDGSCARKLGRAVGLIRVNCPADGLNERFEARAGGFLAVLEVAVRLEVEGELLLTAAQHEGVAVA